ncbi:UNKNOWN [Stylonychia lemnae]|uniref:J domain-containing protein n=1 Tax=Stylonychia lemnae TaxID=5949 RepID=A0A078B2U6_STYLE|nr:UNKNOWN [Stylonychia lemnae]|eukprot:CDW88850.1 UNKNOWN [Stylonychia lemnae]
MKCQVCSIMQLEIKSLKPTRMQPFRNPLDPLIQIALKLHPDKNRSPISTDAFNKLNQVYRCLSNQYKRDSSDEKDKDDEVIDTMGLANKKHDIYNIFYGENYRKKKTKDGPIRRYIGKMKAIEWKQDDSKQLSRVYDENKVVNIIKNSYGEKYIFVQDAIPEQKMLSDPVIFRYRLEKAGYFQHEFVSPKLGLTYYIDNESLVTLQSKKEAYNQENPYEGEEKYPPYNGRNFTQEIEEQTRVYFLVKIELRKTEDKMTLRERIFYWN